MAKISTFGCSNYAGSNRGLSFSGFLVIRKGLGVYVAYLKSYVYRFMRILSHEPDTDDGWETAVYQRFEHTDPKMPVV